MNDFELAFDELLDSAEEAKGFREKITFQGADKDMLPLSDDLELEPVGGGVADGMPIKVSLRLREVTLPVDNLAPVVVKGRDLAVISYTVLEGRVDLNLGDPSLDYGNS